MPDSPLSFFGPETWLDDDEIDRQVIAGRLGASEFTTADLAQLIHVTPESIRAMTTAGRLFPSRFEAAEGGRGVVRSVYSAEKAAGLLLERGMPA